jgi:hypothetical protein
VISIPVLAGWRTALFLRMAGHQGGVQADHQARHDRARAPYRQDSAAGFAAQPLGPFPGSSPGELHMIQQRFAYRVEGPPRGRRGGHRPEQARLVAQHREIADRDAAVGEHHRHMGADTRPPVLTVTFGYDAIRCTGRVPSS